ncbi:MAG: hypothetical protein ACOYXR_04450 [Nitrospirota bacterium]
MRRNNYLAALALIWLCTACASSSEGDVQQREEEPVALQTLFTPSDMAVAAVPDRPNGVGFDNYKAKGNNTQGSNEFHYQGKDCLRCHTANAKAAVVPFTMAGTVYKDLLGSEPLAGAEVVLLDGAGHVISMTTNAAGNFMTQTPIAEDPNSTATPKARTYKTWILGVDGTVLPMVTMTSGSCNQHHTPFVWRGAMWAGSWSAAPKAPLPSDTNSKVSFNRDVLPIFGAKCLPCHAPTNAERLLADDLKAAGTKYDYTAEFDLVEYDSVIDKATGLPRHGISGRPLINLDHPEDSLLLAKMLGPETSHGGGKIATSRNDRDYQTLLRWIQEGAAGPEGH